MSPALTNGSHDALSSRDSTSKRSFAHESLRFEPHLKPKPYHIAGTPQNSKILFRNVNILDSTGAEPYRGDVYIKGERIIHVGFVPNVDMLCQDSNVRIIEGQGRTLMSGLGDAHTHFTWNNGALDLLGNVKVEEHVLITARSAQCYLDSGYTMCYGAASAKDRLDCVIRDAINNGGLPGPRYLANAREIARRDGELAAGITAFADGPLEMREIIRHHAKLGVDQIKLSMSGEAITEDKSAEDCYYSDEETAACVDEAHRHGLRLCAHARARDSVIQCVRHGVDVIYHASYIDSVGMSMLEKAKHKHVVAPAINWLYATVHEATPFGYTFEKAEQVGYRKELEVATKALREMHNRGITILPGGDYGFAWCPHGTYARDLEHFVKLLDFTPMESIVAATAGVAKLFMQEDELGKIAPGYYADCILVDGDPLRNIAVLQDHDKLNVIMINGRIHKASSTDFLPAQLTPTKAVSEPSFNFVAYTDHLGRSRVGHMDLNSSKITSMNMASGSPLENMYQVIELGSDVVLGDAPFPMSEVKLLPPISDRDVLCVGNNYAKHIKEYRASGFDSSAQPPEAEFPTIFTKRSTSIIASGEEIYPHPSFTSTIDYEGEVGVIIGKAGFCISEQDAMDYVWGYTIINDVSAREKQRDHKQFYVGKSPDTFCPMGPVAVPASSVPHVLKIETYVNGEKRQNGTTMELMASIPRLIQVLSASTTLRPGDVIATGTPDGVGVGMKPPTFLKPGDLVEVSVTGLGKLSNRIADSSSKNYMQHRVSEISSLPIYNLDKTWSGIGLTKLGDKLVKVKTIGSGSQNLVFIHGLGASLEYYMPLIQVAGLDKTHQIYLYDLEGHGMTSANASSKPTLDSYAADLGALFAHHNITSAVLLGWSLGGLIAMNFATQHSALVSKLILLGPGPTPFPEAGSEVFFKRAASVRAKGMEASGVVDAVANAATSTRTKTAHPLSLAAVRQSLLATHPEGYAKGCVALASSVGTTIPIERLAMPTLIVTGGEDKISPPQLAKAMKSKMQNATVEILPEVGHWHIFEDVDAVARALKGFL